MLNLICMDMETSGLFPKSDYILELSYCLIQIENHNRTIGDSKHLYVANSPILLQHSLTPEVIKFHTENKLLEDLKYCHDKKTLCQVESIVVDDICNAFGNLARVMLVGFNLSFLNDFIKEKLPKLEQKLYRTQCDLTSLGILSKFFGTTHSKYTVSDNKRSNIGLANILQLIERLEINV